MAVAQRVVIAAHHPAPRKIAMGAETLRRGGVIALPGDFGPRIAALAHDKGACMRVEGQVAKRSPLTLYCRDIAALASLTRIQNGVYRQLKKLNACELQLPIGRGMPNHLRNRKPAPTYAIVQQPIAHNLLAAIDAPLATWPLCEGDTPVEDVAVVRQRFAFIDLIYDVDEVSWWPVQVLDFR
ncbi:MAG: Sua5/YciO/YrdC/YwlC family protein [Polyangiales bacterium]